MRRPYREEVSTLTKWCQENHLSLNIDKTKELVVDYRRQSREHTPITIDKTPVERVSSFKFLGVHITEDLTWSAHTDAVLKKAHQRLFFLRRLSEVWNEPPEILRSFYTLHCGEHPDRLLSTAWFGNSTAGNRRALQRVVRTARHIVGGELSLPPGYLHQAVYKESPEDYQRLQPPVPQTALSAALRATFPQHPIPALADEGQLFPSGYQANEQSQITHLHHTPTHHNMHCTLTPFNRTTRTPCTNTTYLLSLDTIQCTSTTLHYA